LGRNTGIVPVPSKEHPCLLRDEQAGKPAQRFRLEAEVTLSCALAGDFPIVVKKRRRFKFDEVRQRFRLTPTERRVAVFVLAAFVLGLITKCYRDARPSPTPVETRPAKARTSSSSPAKVDQPHAVNAGQATRRMRKSAEKLDLPGAAAEH